ncbi:MAG: PQQ-dependent sugar dehydrogenase [Gemmataceae bacterium]
MMNPLRVGLLLCWLLTPSRAVAQPADTKPFGLAKRIPWTASRIKGAPEPPPPYRSERAFPHLTFKNPLHLTTAPGIHRFFVCEQGARIYSFPIDLAVKKADLVIDLRKEIKTVDPKRSSGIGDLYALVFHPRFTENRYCYVCYILNPKGSKQLEDGSRISRFRLTDTDPPRIDPASEKIIITWLGGGHNGCDLHFGPDGYLYISTGDGAGPNPPDGLTTGQDNSDLLSCILRIDVDHPDKGEPGGVSSRRNYSIPSDNPFVKTPGNRPEIWAYGFRNPWRMSFDRKTGRLWVGDVGWESWEMIYCVKKGGNYGWSIMEGPQPVRPETKRGPTPILPPALALPHSESASITGGYVYHGKLNPDLKGLYLFGDWVTRKVWGAKLDGDKIVSFEELAATKERVVAFGLDHDRELYYVNHDEAGSIHKLVPNEAVKAYRKDFPRKLSETGLFADVKKQVPMDGVVPFSVNAELWADHASAERFVALPGTSVAKIYSSQPPWPNNSGEVYFPGDGVLVKTLSMEMERGNPKSRRKLETQILHFDGDWHAYTYAWNDEQTDASLVDAKGMDRELKIVDAKAPGGKREQRWHFASRTECMTCHNPWSGYTLAFNPTQLNRNHDYHGVVDHQFRALEHAGMITFLDRDWDKKVEKPRKAPTERLVDPYDPANDIQQRARSYLHVNCSHCHQFGAGGTATIDLRHGVALDSTKMLGVRPSQGTFEIAGASIVAPGDPFKSVLFYRLAKLGPGRMPHMGSEVIDERGLALIRDWIRRLPAKEESALLDGLKGKSSREARAALIQKSLSSTTSALMLADAMGGDGIPPPVRGEVLKAALAHSNPLVRDLFERFVPADQRTKRLGSVIRPEQILAKKGDAARGRELFFKSAGLQCATCHKIDGKGGSLGPDLSDVGKKYSRGQILESILEPSKVIDPKYVTYLVETQDGKVVTGILVEKTEKQVVLRTLPDMEVRLTPDQIATMVPQPKSLMPELLLRDVTLDQARDLLEFLASLTASDRK